MANHSKIVGGSTAKRVMNCYGSVALAMKAPPQPPSEYAIQGTMLHEVIANVLDKDEAVPTTLDDKSKEKIEFAIKMLDQVDPDGVMEFAIEQEVNFGNELPEVFGSVDLIGRIGKRVVVLDWKFGDGVIVDAEENEQLMFYAAAAKSTPALEWVFKDVIDIELIIVQPFGIKRWVTTFDRIAQFKSNLIHSVNKALQFVSQFGPEYTKLSLPDLLSIMRAGYIETENAFNLGTHCRWCPIKECCPLQENTAAHVLNKPLYAPTVLGEDWLTKLDVLENWITDMRAIALKQLEAGNEIKGWKLVAKRALRKWVDEQQAKANLIALGLKESEITETALLSPAQAEKVLKKYKMQLPEDSVVAISSGNTLAPESDPRAAIKVTQQDVVTAAFKKLD